ncbi:glycosyltransferase [Azospirillum largimobile]
MKVSLVVPCTHRDIACVPRLLQTYASAPVKPDQVIVSLSLAPLASKSALSEVGAIGAAFDDFTLIKHEGRMRHGPNRQAGSIRAIHEIISYQDADDEVHPQRISIIKAMFETQDIVHLNHTMVMDGEDFPKYDTTTSFNVRRNQDIFNENFGGGWFVSCKERQNIYGQFTGWKVASGLPTIRRSVLERVRWKDWNELYLGVAEDYEFNTETCFAFRKSMIIDAALIKYTPFARRETTDELLGVVPPTP